MALIELSNIKQLFGGESTEPSPEVYKELLLMVLARATDVDAYTHPAEVETVREILHRYVGEDVSSADVRIAAKSALYETAPLEKYISEIGPKLAKEDRLQLLGALIEVVHADDNVASAEAGFFNMVCEALDLTFADVVGLRPD